MKVFVDDKVYVQKGDLVFLTGGPVVIAYPKSIFEKVEKEIQDNDNWFDFVEFESKEEIDFFMSADWIIDYHDFDNMNIYNFMKYAANLQREKKRTSETFNSLSLEERKGLYSEASKKLDLIDYQLRSLKNLANYKRGYLNYPIPGVDLEKEGTSLQRKKRR